MEIIMKTIIQITTATIFVTGLLSLISPANATTNTREAMAVCSKKPNCQMSVGEDGVVITVNPGTNGTVIICPIKNGPCGVMTRTVNNDPFNNNQGRNNGGGEAHVSSPGGPSFY
jgi:hypothetical protein